ncbi:MAG: hypothetical protein M1814_002955 [Vezdaea aestivalis]|nr:MAG: hypothetical protein M1814_002955 [Vezdaea aestivalis]
MKDRLSNVRPKTIFTFPWGRNPDGGSGSRKRKRAAEDDGENSGDDSKSRILPTSLPIRGGPSQSLPSITVADNDGTVAAEDEEVDKQDYSSDSKPLGPNNLPTPGPGMGFRNRHAAVIVAVLHRFVLSGDYQRAGRALGLILRTRINSAGPQLRRDGFWGFGAEIILRRPAPDQSQEDLVLIDSLLRPGQMISPSFGPSSAEVKDQRSLRALQSSGSPSFFPYLLSRFPDVKEYYDRLILQCGVRNQGPNLVSATDFYYALFGLWISSIQERVRRTEERGVVEPAKCKGHGATSLRAHRSDLRLHRPIVNGKMSPVARIEAYRAAKVLETRMEELMIAPPYSDDPSLVLLRAMLHVYFADLVYQIKYLLCRYPKYWWQTVDADGKELAKYWMHLVEQTHFTAWETELEGARKIFKEIKAEGGEIPKVYQDNFPELSRPD